MSAWSDIPTGWWAPLALVALTLLTMGVALGSVDRLRRARARRLAATAAALLVLACVSVLVVLVTLARGEITSCARGAEQPWLELLAPVLVIAVPCMVVVLGRAAPSGSSKLPRALAALAACGGLIVAASVEVSPGSSWILVASAGALGAVVASVHGWRQARSTADRVLLALMLGYCLAAGAFFVSRARASRGVEARVEHRADQKDVPVAKEVVARKLRATRPRWRAEPRPAFTEGFTDVQVAGVGPMSVAVTEGELDSEIVRRVLRLRFAEVRYCYDQRPFLRLSQARGFTLELTIGAEGRVEAARVGRGVPPGAIEQCVLRAASRWRFPLPGPPGVARVRAAVPLRFECRWPGSSGPWEPCRRARAASPR